MDLKTNVNKQNRIAIIGPIIIDSKSSGGEGEKLYQKLKEEGYTVYKRSIHRGKFQRMINTLWFLLTKSKEYDTVILLLFSGKAFILEYISAILAKFLNKKIIGVLHGGAFHQFYTNFPNFSDYLFEKCDAVYTPSVFLKNYFLARGTVVQYLPNFIPLEQFKNPEKKRVFQKRLLWVRGFHDIYNPEMAIKTMAELLKKHPDAKLTMIGPDKGTMESCKELSNTLKVSNNISFIGFVPNNELISYFQNADIYINTTRYESFGVALMEAAGTALPIVSTNVGEIPLLWDNNSNILLCEDGDFVKMSEHLCTLIENDELRDRVAENGQKLTQQFTWSQIGPEWHSILQNII
jgi:glycosyltransferase involved in cell wall biosynthesis